MRKSASRDVSKRSAPTKSTTNRKKGHSILAQDELRKARAELKILRSLVSEQDRQNEERVEENEQLKEHLRAARDAHDAGLRASELRLRDKYENRVRALEAENAELKEQNLKLRKAMGNR